MNLQEKLNIITAVSTTLAVIVALAISVIPPLFRKKNNLKISKIRIRQSLKSLNHFITEYRKYNIITIIMDNNKLFSYSLDKIKMEININHEFEINELITNLVNLRTKESIIVLDIVDNLKQLFYGFPMKKEKWDEIQNKINSALQIL